MAKNATITAAQRERFLKELAESRNVTVAARAVGIARRAALELRAADEDFALAWADAEEEATDLLEHAVRQRAMKGVEEPVYYHGQVVGHVRRFSEELMLLFLRAERPEKFGQRPAGGGADKQEAGQRTDGHGGSELGPDGGVLVVPAKLDPQTWSEQVRDYQRQLTNGGGGGG